MKEDKLNSELISLMKNFIKENNIELNEKMNFQTRLIGTKSEFDSLDLVTFIVEAEHMLNDKFNLQIQLASEKALSRRRSPFTSLETLSLYIIELCNE